MIVALLSGCLVNADLHRERRDALVCLDGGPGCGPGAAREHWPDCDGDGWGAPGPAETLDPRAVAPPECAGGVGRWVRNPSDCDDDDPASGARVGVACPDEIAAVSELAVASGREVLFAIPEAPVDAEDAADRCEAWGGGLAVPEDPAVVARLLDLADLGGPGPAGPWVDLGLQDGSLGWGDGTPLTLPVCIGADPLAWFSALPEAARTRTRLVLHLEDGVVPCVDVPDDPYAADSFACERPLEEPAP